MSVILAFDLERAGATVEYDTIALGASVIDEKGNELANLFIPGYFPEKTKFEERCWDEFWSKNTDILDLLKYEGELSPVEVEKEMITNFHQFRKHWEDFATQNNCEFYLVTDNISFDVTFINLMMFKHLPGVLPIPYSASSQKYSSVIDICQMARGFAADPNYAKKWGFNDHLDKILEGHLKDAKKVLPLKAKEHKPDIDAHYIAVTWLRILYFKEDF